MSVPPIVNYSTNYVQLISPKNKITAIIHWQVRPFLPILQRGYTLLTPQNQLIT